MYLNYKVTIIVETGKIVDYKFINLSKTNIEKPYSYDIKNKQVYYTYTSNVILPIPLADKTFMRLLSRLQNISGFYCTSSNYNDNAMINKLLDFIFGVYSGFPLCCVIAFVRRNHSDEGNGYYYCHYHGNKLKKSISLKG